jgi:hypothetical protein
MDGIFYRTIRKNRCVELRLKVQFRNQLIVFWDKLGNRLRPSIAHCVLPNAQASSTYRSKIYLQPPLK